MNKIKYRNLLFSVAFLLLSSLFIFQITENAKNIDSKGNEELATVINEDLPETSSPISEPLKQTSNNLDELYEQAAVAQKDLDKLTRKVASQFGGEPLIPETLKTRKRSEEKIAADYNGDASRITDLARSSVIFATESQVLQALEALQQDMNVIRIKNRFANPVNGYRDVLLNISMPNQHIVEMQLHLRTILDAKYEFGDKIYQEIRTIEANAIQEKRNLTPDEVKRLESLRNQAEELYNDAFAKSKSQ